MRVYRLHLFDLIEVNTRLVRTLVWDGHKGLGLALC